MNMSKTVRSLIKAPKALTQSGLTPDAFDTLIIQPALKQAGIDTSESDEVAHILSQLKITPVPWGDFLFSNRSATSRGRHHLAAKIHIRVSCEVFPNVRYTVAIRQAPHPLQSFCAVMAQNRQLLACSVVTPCTYVRVPSRVRPLHYYFCDVRVFGAEHKTNTTKTN